MAKFKAGDRVEFLGALGVEAAVMSQLPGDGQPHYEVRVTQLMPSGLVPELHHVSESNLRVPKS